MSFIRYQIGVWTVDEQVNNELAAIVKVEKIDLEGDKFNKFVTEKLAIIKKLIEEI